MMNKLTIFWGSKNTDSFTWWLDENRIDTGNPIHELEEREILKADLACMADMASQYQVELILDCNDIHINQVEMPNKAQRHLRKAVPYMLEEQLAEPVDKVFIVLGGRTQQNKIPVRAINLHYFTEIIEQFKSAEIKLHQVVMELDLLPTPKEGYLLILKDEQIYVKDESGFAWHCDIADFSWLIQKQLIETTEDEELPIAIPLTVVCEVEEEFKLFEPQLPVGRFAAQSEIVSSIESYFANSTCSPINFLQAEFEPKAEKSPHKAMYMKVAAIAGILLGTHLLYQASAWFSLEQQRQYLGQQRTALWKQAFPGRKVPSNPDKVLRSYLSTLAGGDGSSSFLAMLQSTTEKITDLTKVYPTNISYDAPRGELRVDLIAKDLAVLNQYRDELKQSGHQVDMSSATQRGDGYSSRLIIRRQ